MKNTTKKQKDARVLAYVDSELDTPLHFDDRFALPISTGSLKDLIMDIFRCMEISPSLDEEEQIETYMDRNRSSLDTWRHVIFFRPEVTIFEVMRTIYSLIEEDHVVGSTYCSTICRRVFRRTITHDDWIRAFCEVMFDEYRLVWDDWKTIGPEEGG